ncbi:MAG: tetratricopeptide repeat protein [Coriobacteriia bacterium]
MASSPARKRGRPSGRRSMSSVELQKLLLTATLALMVVILASVVTVVLYGLQLQKAPRTLEERTLAVAETAVKEKPDDPSSWLMLAYAEIEIGRFAAAGEAIATGKAIMDLPDFYVADAYRAEAAGDSDEAIDLYEAAKQRALEYRKARDAEVAAVGARLTGPNTALADAAIGKARLLARAGDLKRALVEYDTALEVDSRMSDILVERGDVRARTGDTQGAKSDYEAALEFVPDMPEALDGLARIEAGDE